MATVFNKYGVVEDVAVTTAMTHIEEACEVLFKMLVEKGIPPMELRAVQQYLESGISCVAAGELLRYQMELHKAEHGDGRKTQCG